MKPPPRISETPTVPQTAVTQPNKPRPQVEYLNGFSVCSPVVSFPGAHGIIAKRRTPNEIVNIRCVPNFSYDHFPGGECPSFIAAYVADTAKRFHRIETSNNCVTSSHMCDAFSHGHGYDRRQGLWNNRQRQGNSIQSHLRGDLEP